MSLNNLKKLSFLVYGLGLTGKSIINFFEKNKIKNYQVWDDNDYKLFPKKRPKNLNKALDQVNYIVLSPGVSLKKSKNKHKLKKYKNKIITDLDLIYILKKFSKSIVVTGTNGKSTTCKMISHLLKKNGYNILLGGNIGTPVLDLDLKKNNFLILEASSFQLAHSKFIRPDYSLLLNISNDHIDWHGNMKNYINSKLKIFKYQRKNHFSFLNQKLKTHFKKKKFQGKLIIPNQKNFQKIKFSLKNSYLTSDINDENMSFVLELSKILKISQKSFLKTMKSFVGLPHRYEIFLKKKNHIFVNDSKATSFQASKFALQNSNNIYWIVGGLPKKNDKIILKNFKSNIIKSYIVGKNTNFFKSQIQNKLPYIVSRTLKKSVILILKEIRASERKNCTILLSPASASFDQYLNFEKRGEEFKRLCRYYARKYI